MITDIADYFTLGCGRCARFATPACSVRQWHDGLAALRTICRDSGLTEAVKWGHPCYMHAGRNIAIIGAFRDDFRLTFFNAALMRDPDGLLERQGPQTRHPDMIRFTSAAQIDNSEPTLRAYLAEAMGYAAAGVKPPRVVDGVILPDILIAALNADPDLAAAFHALTPGQQKSYVIGLASTKSPTTQTARITRWRPRIVAGKGALER